MKTSVRLFSFALAALIVWGCTACSGDTAPSDVSGNAATSAASASASDGRAENSSRAEDSSAAPAPVSSAAGTGKTDPAGTVTSGRGSTAAATVTKQAGGTTSLSRDQVMAKMPAGLRGTTLHFLFWGDYKDTYMKSAVEGFEKATGITVKTDVVSKDAMYTTLAGRINSGKSPDMSYLIANHVSYVTNFQPISSTGFDFNDAAWDKDLMKAFTFNGRTYAVNLKDTPFRNMTVLAYNKKALIDRAELDDPYQVWKKNPKAWTWDKVFSICSEFLKANRNKDGFYGITYDMPDSFLGAFGAGLYGYDADAGRYVSLLGKAETPKAYEKMVGAIEKRQMAKEADSQAFISGYIPFVLTFSSSLEKGSDIYEVLKKNDNYGVVPLPVDSRYNPLFETVAYGVPVGAKNAAAVPYFVRYVMDPKSYDMNTFWMSSEAAEVIRQESARTPFYGGNAGLYEVWQKIRTGTVAQVRGTLDSYASVVDGDVKDLNNQMKNLPK